MTLKREIKNAYIENGHPVYIKTHSNAVYVDENETETLTQRLDNVKSSITEHTSQLDNIETLNIKLVDYKHLVIDNDWTIALQSALNDGYNQKRNVVAHHGNFKLTSTIYIPPLITFSQGE